MQQDTIKTVKRKATEEGEKLRIRANKGLVVRIKNFYNSNKKDKPILRRAKKKNLDYHFSEEYRHMANKYMKRYSLSVIRERQTKTTVPLHIQEDDRKSH